jgi:lysozyme
VINAATLQLIKSFEGCKLKSYQDSVGVWTVGYGHTKGVKPNQTITQAQADQFLREDLQGAEGDVDGIVTGRPLSENERGALISFTFNLGAGNLRKLLKNGLDAVPERILLFDHAGGRQLAGLTRRRKAERDLFLKQ